ncbi:MAG: peptide deformylase [Spirochaetes bacterium]|nr:peptide deformylase [Spirochaetota bacterium]
MKKKRNRIITFKDSLIRSVSEEVKNIDSQIKELGSLMEDIMHKHDGIGLAAIQIGEKKRVITIDITKCTDDPVIKPIKITLVNPKILSMSGRTEEDIEGCLSVPGKKGTVKRHFWIEVEGYTLNGEYFHKKIYDLAARVVQHEIDHLNGILFIDKINEINNIIE